AARRRAAGLWADARRRGTPTADPRSLDCDVILAAQALQAEAVVATENVGQLSRYGRALHWRDTYAITQATSADANSQLVDIHVLPALDLVGTKRSLCHSADVAGRRADEV